MCVSGTTTELTFQSVTALAIRSPPQGFYICWMPEHSTAVQRRTGRVVQEARHWNKKRLIFKIKTIKLCLYGLTTAKTVVIFLYTPLSKEIIRYPEHSELISTHSAAIPERTCIQCNSGVGISRPVASLSGFCLGSPLLPQLLLVVQQLYQQVFSALWLTGQLFNETVMSQLCLCAQQ